MSEEILVNVKEVTKLYPGPSGDFPALRGISLQVRRGRMISVVGKSGSGKSTLMNVLTGIDRPTRGEVIVAGAAVHALPERALAAWRGRNVGIVFQFFQLLPTLTIAENVMLPMDFLGTFPGRARRERALSLLERVGVEEQADKFPSALSGGQQQRAAIARALANDPPLLVADEPTGNLDSRTAGSVFELFSRLAQDGKTVVVVTHETAFADYFQETVTLADGRRI